jgi:uncharacterized cofD-like protein
MSDGPKVVAIGGGHGLATTLRAARCYASQLTAVVSVADDGGSSGRLRKIAGIPAPGDLRRCLVAMAPESSQWARAFEYRFGSGDLAGHALGNLVIAGLAASSGDFGWALQMASDLLATVGRVLPASSVPVVLKAEAAGRQVMGQVEVSNTAAISSVAVVPADAPSPPEVLEAIACADQVIIGPGSLYTSVLAACVVPGVRQALEARSGGRVYVANLRPQPPETAGFGELDHLRAVLAHKVPVDAMVKMPTGWPGACTPQEVAALGVRPVVAEVALADGSGHDPVALAAVLSQLS